MGSKGPAAIWWVRRDFRLADNPALRSAIDDGEAVLPLFVLDPYLLGSAGQVRRAWLMAALYGLDSDLRNAGGSGLSVTSGNPAAVVPHSAMPLRTFLSRCAGGTCTRERRRVRPPRLLRRMRPPRQAGCTPEPGTPSLPLLSTAARFPTLAAGFHSCSRIVLGRLVQSPLTRPVRAHTLVGHGKEVVQRMNDFWTCEVTAS